MPKQRQTKCKICGAERDPIGTAVMCRYHRLEYQKKQNSRPEAKEKASQKAKELNLLEKNMWHQQTDQEQFNNMWRYAKEVIGVGKNGNK